jgi:hypothetical protein
MRLFVFSLSLQVPNVVMQKKLFIIFRPSSQGKRIEEHHLMCRYYLSAYGLVSVLHILLKFDIKSLPPNVKQLRFSGIWVHNVAYFTHDRKWTFPVFYKLLDFVGVLRGDFHQKLLGNSTFQAY